MTPFRQLRRATLVAVVVILVAAMLAPGAWAQAFKVLHPFRFANGPRGAVARDAAGNLYGTTAYGGGSGCSHSGCGTVWKLTPNSSGTWTATILHVFEHADGATPAGGLILDAAGNLYGTTTAGGTGASSVCTSVGGCGVVFKLRPNSNGRWTESVLHSFNFSDGFSPYGSLVFDRAGNLYGTTLNGGSFTACQGAGCGVVFKLKPNSDGTWTQRVIHTFTGTDGAGPEGRPIFDEAGNLYGTTSGGGSKGGGVVFRVEPNSNGTWTEKVLHAFTLGTDGGNPFGDLIFDATGSLYGTTMAGGASSLFCGCSGYGTVFKLVPDADGIWRQTVIHSFAGPDGAYPYASLTFDGAGNLYGATTQGGIGSSVGEFGVVFKLTPTSSGWCETIVHTFQGYGRNPDSPLFFDQAGNLYGTTMTGAANGGLVFEITP